MVKKKFPPKEILKILNKHGIKHNSIKMKKIFITLFIILFVFLNQATFADQHSKGTRFIVAGHLYPIIKDIHKLNEFISKINSYKPDYVFLLGDSNLQDKKSFDYFQTTINSKILYVPGNNELRISKDGYIDNVGYLNKVILEKDVKFILLDSSDSLENIKKYLNKNLSKPFTEGPTIILTHHRIWDDTIISKKPYQHDKSYYFEDVYPLIKDKIHSIFSGNSKRQYFRDLKYSVSYGKQNVNLTYWADKIGDINAYSVGMGNGVPKANFVIVDVLQKDLLIKGDYTSTESYEVLPKNLIEYNKNRLSLEHTSDLKKFVASEYYLVKKKKIYQGLGVSLLIVVYFVFRRFKKN